MSRTIFEKFKQYFQTTVLQWRRVPLRAQRIVTIGLPLLAVAISASIALIGNHQRANIQADVERKFQMTAALSNVLTLMVNAETGMRGYLLTTREEFLQPFATASENLPATMNRLRSLAEAEPGEKPRLEKVRRLGLIQQLIEKQMSDLAAQKSYVRAPGTGNMTDTDIYTHLAYGKGLMDEIRVNLNSMQAEEGRLLTERVAEINTVRQRDFIAVFLALIVGLGTRLVAWYLFNTGVLRRINHLVENTRSLRQDKSLPFPPTDKRDALGDLEREIALASGAPPSTDVQTVIN
jgi:CHASE3 domain sensor protein